MTIKINSNKICFMVIKFFPYFTRLSPPSMRYSLRISTKESNQIHNNVFQDLSCSHPMGGEALRTRKSDLEKIIVREQDFYAYSLCLRA